VPTRFDLPNGNWADIRDAREVTRKQRKPVQSAYMALRQYRSEHEPPQVAEGETPAFAPEELDLANAINEPMVIALVEAWSYEQPVTLDGLDEIPAPDADALIEHCAGINLFPDLSAHSLEDDSPT
jgi:hypothetical protein